jgi:hypothetical protein
LISSSFSFYFIFELPSPATTAVVTSAFIIYEYCSVGLGMQKEIIDRKGCSSVYSRFPKLIPQNIKLNLKGNYF